jgi:elongation factor Ts
VAAITIDMIKELREATGAGVLDCKETLQETGGDLERAAELLREKGLAAAAKRADREADEGLVGSYIHAGSRVAALVEVNCETDFVAHTDLFQELAHDLAMQIVAAKPRYMSREDVPPEVIRQEKEDYRARMQDKPEHVLERIVEGKLNKFYEEVCLLEQPFIKEPGITVNDLVQQRNAQLGENIVVRRFVRFEVGGE